MVHCTRVVLCSCSHTSVMEPVTIYVGLAARACSSVEAKETCTPWRPSSSASERLNQSAMVELAVNTEPSLRSPMYWRVLSSLNMTTATLGEPGRGRTALVFVL